MFQIEYLIWWYVFLVAVVTMAQVTTAQENNQLQAQARVYEKVDNFMSVPVSDMQNFADYFKLQGFPNNLEAPDRSESIKYMYSLVNGFGSRRIKPVFYALDNGLVMGYWQESPLDMVPLLAYREPGMSGFSEDNEDMSMHWGTCVNTQTGEDEKCVMQEGEPYIECVDDCELIPCPDEVSQTNCSILPTTAQQRDCESNKKFCHHYSIEHVQPGETEPKGYVPTTIFCMNANGDVSQTPGEIRYQNPEGSILNNGTCTFGSGALVQRNLTGPFAYCAKEKSGECNTTFVGGYESIMYDPRYRGWFISARNAQRPVFSDPYLFFGSSFTNINSYVGITYVHPIYQTDDKERQVFHGNLAVDVALADLAEFLVDSFKETYYVVGIYEDREPFKMMGVSTGSSVVIQVLHNDTNHICSDEQIQNARCVDAQLTIHDLANTGAKEDNILRKAHLAFEEIENDPEQIVTIRENDEKVDSTTYLATSLIYEQPGANLKWRIVVCTAIEDDSEDSITKDEGIFALVCLIGILGFILCFTLLVLFYQRRNEQAVQFADVRFTSAFILGCALLNLSTLTLLGENTDELCLLRMWVFYLLSSICLSPLFIKVFRTWKLLGATVSSALQTKKMNNFQAWLRTLPIPIMQTIILLIFTYVDPPVATESVDWNSRPVVKGVTCKHETIAFYITQALFDLTLIVSGCVLAYLTRNIDHRFGDAKALLFAMYNIAFTVVMIAVIFASVNISDSASRVLKSIGVFWATVFSSAGFIVPRLMAAKQERKKMKSERFIYRSKRPRTVKFSSIDDDSIRHHSSEGSLKILVCTANLGNAEPTLSSMKAWIPENGSCVDIRTLDGERVESEKFHLIVIGMQEATWGSKKKKEEAEEGLDSSQGTATDTGDKEGDSEDTENSAKRVSLSDLKESEREQEIAKEDMYMAAVQGEDTVALRKMVRSLLGEDYKAIAQEIRGQMRLHVWALNEIVPYIDKPKISGANTGIGNVLANKGGIVVSLNCMDTRLTFLSAHLAAHEGENYYKSRCDNVYDILRSSKTFDLSQKFDVAISSHHMFVLGDLNFRTKFEGENEHEENFKRAMELVKAEDWSSLYSYDELHKGIKEGHLLVDFQTLPCNFNPTFKVNRTVGFDYTKQRTPSYTDRILFKSSQNLHQKLKPIAYQPCVDFITSDHKPVRGAFSIVPNDMIEPKILPGKFRLVFSEIECSDLLAGDVEGSSDPYVIFVWDAIEMAEDNRRTLSLGKQKWPRTGHKSKTLNPKWPGKKISLVTTSYSISSQAMLYVGVFDYDFMSDDDILGTLPLGINDLVSMEDGQSSKLLSFDRPLERYGKHGGRIKFKLEITMLVG